MHNSAHVDDNIHIFQQSLVAWPYRRERRGHDPAEKKSLLKLVWLALLARFEITHCR